MDIIEFDVNDAMQSKTADTPLCDLNDLQLALIGGGNADISLN